MSIVVIGAGMAGLAAATALQAAGHDVVLYDKGRGPGGRMSSRRAKTVLGDVRFDHGAQFFTARDPAFQAEVESWMGAGIVAPWRARQVEFSEAGVCEPISHQHPRYVGVPSMNALIRAMSMPLSVHWSERVVQLQREGEVWHVCFEGDRDDIRCETVLLAMPREQTTDMLKQVDHGFEIGLLDQAASDPCWAVMLAFEAPLQVQWDAARLQTGALSWVARNSSKPGRDQIETWVLHASPEWSLANLELSPDAVLDALWPAFFNLTRAPQPIFQAAHRWRYSQVKQALGVASLWNGEKQIGVCGDFCLGARIEAAWKSGNDLARLVNK